MYRWLSGWLASAMMCLAFLIVRFFAKAQPWLQIIADDSHGAALDAPDFHSIRLGAATTPHNHPKQQYTFNDGRIEELLNALRHPELS